MACLRSKSVSFGNLQITGRSPQNLYMYIVCTEENTKASSSLSGFGGSFGGLQGKR